MMLGAVVLGLGFGVTAFADTSDTGTSSANATTSTNMGITFTGTYHPSTGGGGANINSDSSSSGNSGESSGVLTDGGDGDAVNEDIPSGHNPTTSVTSGHSAANKPAGAVASVVHSGTADLVAGRLPQTGESQVFLASVFGLFLLIAITLLAVVRWQARLLRENK
ncbi:hypothetical protein FD07_GL001720 [Levilactobacillus parabrevis ATCC 53295]|uniref:Gram-positive cocci surface proteins LPxTG domain-containing protein n=1 Tax=Levilactobacillus parabrevis ATCC 53295 TaxID=1267003 RepID=A0A0R1GKZ0_9LACO|nr:hypothetical protein FD07_GL001720 [Levilactobacillus parabrevis ATCC 53295]KRO04838.1 hypothetical protein IV61_GL001830 [Levilactobacillus parabrevis]